MASYVEKGIIKQVFVNSHVCSKGWRTSFEVQLPETPQNWVDKETTNAATKRQHSSLCGGHFCIRNLTLMPVAGITARR